MKIGSISENLNSEKRISITPEVANKYINLGLEVCLNSNYGLHLGFDDRKYKELKVEILPGDSMEKFKDEINEQFKVKKWKSVKSVGQFKINKKQIENLPKELEKIGSDKDFILVEGKGNEIWVYYYN